MDEKFCTTREAAELLNISLRTAQIWVECGKLRAWKTAGGHRRIARASVQALLEAQMKALQPPPTIGMLKADSPDRSFRILVVEDDSDVRLLYRMSLEDMHAPMSVRFAHDGFEGLYLVGEMAPDLVIADLNMPGLDGFKMIRTLAKTTPSTEVIVVTALSREDVHDRGGLPDGIPVYAKPMPISQLQQVVRRAMQRMRNFRI